MAKAPRQDAKLRAMRSSSKGHWEFRSAQDVSQFWDKYRNVPDRGEAREHHHEERFCLGLYLFALATHDLITYPLSVEEFEPHVSPDFMIRWPSGELTGLEVTKATEEPLQKKKSAAHKEYRRRKIEAAISGTEPEPVTISHSTAGWLDGERERGWCLLFQKAVEKKLGKLREEAPEFRSKFKPAASYDLLVYDDTPFIGFDPTEILKGTQQWIRDLPKDQPAFGKISILMSLDLVFDLGGQCQMFPYVEWSNLKLGDRDSLIALAQRVEEAGQVAVQKAIQKHAAEGRAVHFIDSRGRMIRQTPDGRRFEVKVLNDGEEIVVKDL
ncbi:MAG TPA: hypothetical protein VGH29_15195 [Candidatus Binataceae bacterium]